LSETLLARSLARTYGVAGLLVVVLRRDLGRELNLDARELAGAAGLLLVRVVHGGILGDGLAVRHLGRADVALHVELALHAVHDDLEVQLAHALDDGLPSLLCSGAAVSKFVVLAPAHCISGLQKSRIVILSNQYR
jgi:hypothetical protein